MKHHIKSAQALASAEDHTVHWLKFGLRAALSVLVSLGFIRLLLQRPEPTSIWQSFLQDLNDLAPKAAGGTALTVVSFTAIGHYDAAAAPASGQRGCSGCCAPRGHLCDCGVANAGPRLLTGSILRWRLLPGHLALAGHTINRAGSFVVSGGMGFVTALTLCLLPDAPFRLPASLALGAALSYWRDCARPADLGQGAAEWLYPCKLGVLTAIDTFAAAAALWMLCPPEMALPFATLLPAFLLAFGAGLISAHQAVSALSKWRCWRFCQSARSRPFDGGSGMASLLLRAARAFGRSGCASRQQTLLRSARCNCLAAFALGQTRRIRLGAARRASADRSPPTGGVVGRTHATFCRGSV